jgi:trimethylamine-N-oxide reductase (cytochrome c)
MEPLITRPPNEAGEKTLVRDISWCGVFNGANAAMVDVKDGKIIRIRPARYYDQYTREEVEPWVMHARGQTFEPSDKSLVPPLTLGYKKRVFSPARIRYPMKRADFDPAGAPGSVGPGGRNAQNRGVSKYVRISWNEALDIIAGEMLRIKDTYGPTAILNQSDQHGENKVVHGHGACASCLPVRGTPAGTRQLKAVGGAKHVEL